MKILYLIHIDWDWIFQRPQILALAFDKNNECTVVEHKTVLKSDSNLTKKNRRPNNMIKAPRLPREKVIKIFKPINKMLYQKAVGDFNKYDVVWICYPTYFDYIPSDYAGKVVYDCMDNYVSMAEEQLKQEVFDAEQRLINRADLIFASSKRLIDCVPNMQNAVLVRNGYVPGNIMSIAEGSHKQQYKLGYFGTISEWFDFSLLKESSKIHSNLQYHLIGPTENNRLGQAEKAIIEEGKNNKNGRIVYHGLVEHSELQNFIKDYDVLMMPFIVNETILSVDPVKLYEYISCGKCIISVWYPEIDRFSPFVYFYHDDSTYEELLNELIENGFKPKYNKQQQEEFLAQNTWEERCLIMEEELKKLVLGE